MRQLCLALLLVCGGSSAQCTKDIECKGDRICEKGVCMAPSSSSSTAPTPASVRPAASAPSPKPSIPPAVVGLPEELRSEIELTALCGSPPFPERVVGKLVASGFIAKQPYEVEDGLAKFKAAKLFDVFTFRVVEVHAHPAFPTTARFPGTQLDPQVSFLVAGAENVVKAVLARRMQSHQEVVVSAAPNTKPSAPMTLLSCHGRLD